jgi:hypothetical protein
LTFRCLIGAERLSSSLGFVEEMPTAEIAKLADEVKQEKLGVLGDLGEK